MLQRSIGASYKCLHNSVNRLHHSHVGGGIGEGGKERIEFLVMEFG